MADSPREQLEDTDCKACERDELQVSFKLESEGRRKAYLDCTYCHTEYGGAVTWLDPGDPDDKAYRAALKTYRSLSFGDDDKKLRPDLYNNAVAVNRPSVDVTDGFPDQQSLETLLEKADNETVHADSTALSHGKDESVLHLAVSAYLLDHEPLETVRAVLEAGHDPDARNRSLETPLMMAVKRDGDESLIDVLLQAGADPDCADETYRTPLNFAVANNHDAATHRLLEAGATPDGNRHLPLVTAVEADNADAIDALVEAGADPAATQHYYPKGEVTALDVALTEGTDECVDALIDRMDEFASSGDTTPLHEVAKSNNPDRLKQFLDRGVDPDCTDAYDRTALFVAVNNNSTACVDPLVDAGAAPNGVTDGADPLNEAVRSGQYDVARTLIEAGGDVDEANALHEATANMTPEFMTYLIEDCNASVNGRDDRDQIPLHCLAGTTTKMLVGSEPVDRLDDTARVLLRNGSYVDATDENGRTPLRVLAGTRCPDKPYETDVARRLLDAGASVNQADENNVTPLYRACVTGSDVMVETLLDHGADPDICETDSSNNFSPLGKCLKERHFDKATILMRHGADPERGMSTDALWRGAAREIYEGNLNDEYIKLCLEAGCDPAESLKPYRRADAQTTFEVANDETAKRIKRIASDMNKSDVTPQSGLEA